MAANPHDIFQTIAAPANYGIEEMQNRGRQYAENLARQPYAPYPKVRTAPLSELDILATNAAKAPAGFSRHILEAEKLNKGMKSFPEAQQAYMNPFVEQVVNRMRDQGHENLTRNVMPALDAKFARLGQFGSTRHQKVLGQTARDIQNDMALQEYKARMMGYQNSAENFGRDKASDIERANMMSKLALASQSGRESYVKGLAERGNYQTQYDQMLKNVEYQDFLRQQAHPHDALAKWLAAINNIPYSTSTTGMGIGAQIPTQNSAASYGQMGASLLPLLFGQR